MRKNIVLRHCIALLTVSLLLFSCSNNSRNNNLKKNEYSTKVDSLLALMTIDEKIGQLYQINGTGTKTEALIRKGSLGSIINLVDPVEVNRLQKMACEESRLGIPLLIGRDIIHGFKTIFPIPLGQAASFNPALVKAGASVAATEARQAGINWTFSPMLDVSRDPRWGRIAESFGEDVFLVQTMGVAMIQGYQGENLSSANSIAACAKHFAAYGAAEGGRDYNSVDLSMQSLFNIYLPPFKSAVDAGAASFMVSFNEINGIPSSGNRYLVKDILKNEWKFNGFVVSDWASVTEMLNHGFVSDTAQAAEMAMNAGIDMEMQSTAYLTKLKNLIQSRKVALADVDEAVKRVLIVKFQLGLFKNPYVDIVPQYDTLSKENLKASYTTAVESMVLLKNNDHILPLHNKNLHLAVIGPMANNGYEQLGTWIFDGNEKHSVTPLTALQSALGKQNISFEQCLEYSRQHISSGFGKAVEIARKSDAVVIFAGEESILSGEAHCRADLTLPGSQEEMIKAVRSAGRPVILVVMAGRPLVLTNILPFCDAVVYAWHPGTMGGPAITDILLGKENPSGHLPVSFPTQSGQVPIYYAHKSTGRPANAMSFVNMDSIPVRAGQTSLGNTSHYMDAGYKPLFPFGYGLSYTTFEYGEITADKVEISQSDTLHIQITIHNTGAFDGFEVVQMYISDLVGSSTRPVKELKGFRKVWIKKGTSVDVEFNVSRSDLSFYNNNLQEVAEAGDFGLGIGSNSDVNSSIFFRLVDN